MLWVFAVIYGMWRVLNYDKTPGEMLRAPAQWPAQAPVALQPSGATLIMFVHPQCPCTQASIGELEILMARAPKGFTAYLFFLSPSGFSQDWIKGSLWKQAEKIPGVQIFQDKDGETARYFKAVTSGQTLLYGQDGKLLFQGGITVARGKRGDNSGRNAILANILQGHSDRQKTVVFGCSLFNAPLINH